MGKRTILVVDDEVNILELVKFNLEEEGYKVIAASNGHQAMEALKEEVPDLLILDLMLPDCSGLEICQKIRQIPGLGSVPVIMLTAKSQEQDRIRGFEVGTDDYITKPFSVQELIFRVRAILRRVHFKEESQSILLIGNLLVDVENYVLLKNGVKIELTLKEFEVLKLLIQHKGKVVSRNMLLDQVWGYEYYGETRTVDVHVRHLRQKLEEDDKKPQLIETVRGIGYKLDY